MELSRHCVIKREDFLKRLWKAKPYVCSKRLSPNEDKLPCEKAPSLDRRKEDILINPEVAPEESANKPYSIRFFLYIYCPIIYLLWKTRTDLLCPVISLQLYSPLLKML